VNKDSQIDYWSHAEKVQYTSIDLLPSSL